MTLKISFAVLLLTLMPLAAQTGSRPSFAEPALAPDRAEVAFVSGGDIWTVPLAGGEARLLISHPANEQRPLFSPDGKRLAFTSTRTGNGDVYVLEIATGALKRLTFHEAAERADAWSPDGNYIYYSSVSGDIAGMNDIFRVAVAGGTPMPYSADRYASEYFPAPAPQGNTLAFTAKGIVAAQWWRNGHSHLDESEIWLRHEGAQAKYERVSGGGAKEAWPMWSADGKRLYYMSDRSGAENIWEKAVNGSTPRQISTFKSGRVLWPSISYDGKTIVFERDYGIWRMDPGSGKAAPIGITLRGAPAAPAATRLAMTTNFRDLALSPDGKKVAFTARGDVFAASAKDGGTAQRITSTAALESNLSWLPDNRTLLYTSDREGVSHVCLYDISTNKEQHFASSSIDSIPLASPDGKWIAYVRDGRRLMLIDATGKNERELAQGSFGLPPIEPDRALAWSPDSKWIAYVSAGNREFRNVFVIPVEGGTPVQASFLANTFSSGVTWSPDGKYLLFQTGQRTEEGRIARIDLIPRTPVFREDQFRGMFAPQPPPTVSKTVSITAEGIRRRLSLLPVGVDAGWQTISPDGKWLLMIVSSAGQQNLWLYSLDELAREPAVARQLTSTPGAKRDAWFTPDNKEVYFLEQGRVQVVALDTRQSRTISITADVDVEFSRDKEEVFRQAWSYLNDHFYDEKFHGADWKTLRERTSPYVEGTRTPDELRRVLSLMIGELNASHLGIGPPSSGAPLRTGTLGLRFDRGEYESAGHLRIAEVIQLSPADVAGVKPGQYLLSVDGAALTARTSLDELLEHKAGRRVEITVANTAAGEGKRDIAVSPISGAQEKTLVYRHWVESRRDYVHKASNGRLGYVHMLDMGAASLDQLHVDLDAENHGRQGVVVDVRNNNGGFVNVYALDVLTRRGFLNMTPRGSGTSPARSILGQRSLEKPTILVVNQHSLSDAEDFTEGYRTLKVGKVVGEPTAGWIVYTWNTELIDGSSLRLPRMKITDNNGRNMEMNPRPVDVPVERTFGESYSGKDTQLDVAVSELLKQIGSK